ncbi:hypothetical protein KQY27_06885 [Methanobrevibacter sp. TMH8]|uniref:hypothetical protein n=1 Tax=Methanobrevibacter sp. TMH8 TaxID=2848611 RepID=UPI001CCE479F|nr:hypothetical protein [Methanobrevibacter sp. TMH8]MBZ9571266.1 hypothetical protein [Methanobrevibacter sp. TMH8]
MNKRLFLLIGIFVLVFAFTLNTSFAANEEIWGGSSVEKADNVYDKKIVIIKEVSYKDYENYVYKNYYKINIKKSYQNKYKIKSVNIKYSDFEGKYYSKKYNAKNKNRIIIKSLDMDPVKITIIYSTKSKIKSETTKFNEDSNFKNTAKLKGKKFNVKLTQKGYSYLISGIRWSTITYQKFKVTSKSKKYRIKSVRAFYDDMESGKQKFKTFKGYGKNSLTVNLYGTYEGTGIYYFKIYYY